MGWFKDWLDWIRGDGDIEKDLGKSIWGDPSEEPEAPQWEDYAPPERTYETWTGQQLADWWAQTGQEGNWWDQYASILNPEGQADFDYGVYAGTPLAQMYKEGEGDWQVGKVYPEAYNLYRLRTENPQEWWAQQGYNYQDLEQSQPYQGLTSLIQQWQDPNRMQQDIGAGGQYAAQALGFGTQQEMTDALSGLNQRLTQIDFSGQLTEDQRIALSNDVRMVREENMKMMEALQASGRHSAAFYKADEISSQIADMYVQGKLKYMEGNLLRSQVEFQALQGRYEGMVAAGTRAAGQYADMLVNNRMGALQGYAQQLDTLAQQNSQYIDLYKQHSQQMYNSIMADMGFDAHTMEMAAEAYEAYVTPALDKFEMDLQSYNAWLAGQTLEEDGGGFWDFLKNIAIITATVIGIII